MYFSFHNNAVIKGYIMENANDKNGVNIKDGLNGAHSLAVLLARASEDDPHFNAVAVQIAHMIEQSVNALGDQLPPHAAS